MKKRFQIQMVLFCFIIPMLTAQDSKKAEFSYKELTGIWDIPFGASIETVEEIMEKKGGIKDEKDSNNSEYHTFRTFHDDFQKPLTDDKVLRFSSTNITFATYKIYELCFYFYKDRFYSASIVFSGRIGYYGINESIKKVYNLKPLNTIPVKDSGTREERIEQFITPNNNSVALCVVIDQNNLRNPECIKAIMLTDIKIERKRKEDIEKQRENTILKRAEIMSSDM